MMPAMLRPRFRSGKPLVETPLDAVRQFLLCGADALVLGDYALARTGIPEPLLVQACKQAFASTPLDPLAAALGLEGAGYPEAGAALLEQANFTAERAGWQGPEGLQKYHGFACRLALRRGDVEGAQYHAHQILRWSALPAEALAAAHFLAEHPLVDSQRRALGSVIF